MFVVGATVVVDTVTWACRLVGTSNASDVTKRILSIASSFVNSSVKTAFTNYYANVRDTTMQFFMT